MFLPPPIFGNEQAKRIALDGVDLPDWYYYALICTIGALWLTAYVFAIHRARIDRWCAIPPLAVAINFGWEFNYTFVLYQAEWQRPFNLAWLLLDVFLMTHVLKYGAKDHPALGQKRFRLVVAFATVFAAIMLGSITLDIGDFYGAYTGLVANCFMSPAFLMLLYRRKSSIGQSMYVAFFKGAGTLVGSVMSISLYPHSHIIWVMGCFVLVLDVLYGVLLYRQIRAEGGSPWSVSRPTPPEPAPSALGAEAAFVPARVAEGAR
ncbi:transmembrane-type terpene cyclase [Nocardia mexicana]|uniref:PQ loop repeat protein n=1 Tax=Nocardia mexicana TaxID=279262 RepID=A0A370H1U8_9NOCA|nr:hypothetical protein [Nocardia mexicana]RDI49986.1 hypothetical protein DFR68_106424 [Nocardia mexicana]